MIVIVDYDCGNLGSIKNMLKKIGFQSTISSDVNEITNASKIILPGVGSFDPGVRALKEKNLWDVLNKKVTEEKTPTLGICLGMQLMTKGSQEGLEPGLGWIDAQVVKFPLNYNGQTYKVPNIGWNFIELKNEATLFQGLSEEPKFYFVHSYYVQCNVKQDIAAQCEYGIEYTCSFQRDNIYGVQFHPEKSHKHGMALLANFANL
ncbi:MAG: imidazole glycerol phosphate synthase subunit HisH [Flavobacteriales bacterium]